jgi:enoyl-CoA hydratase
VSELLAVERRERVLVVSLRRENKRNAVDRDLANAIDEAMNLLDDDPELWIGVLTGTPTVFSAGSDLTSRGDYVTTRGGEYGIIRRRRTKPLIAAVEGMALGGGFEIVLACDLVVAARDARFGLPEVRRSLVPTCAGLFRGPRALPLNVARELTLTGEPVGAERLHTLGFVNLLTEAGGALDAAIAMAERICLSGPVAVRACLEAIDSIVSAEDDAGWAATERASEAIRVSEDMHEGLRAFFEKRTPKWKGR